MKGQQVKLQWLGSDKEVFRSSGRHIEWLADDPVTWLGQTPRIAMVRGLVENTSPAFRADLWRMSERLGLDVDCIAGTMVIETGGTFDPAERNRDTNATGLIQFMPDTAILLGTTIDQLARMTAIEQLYYVEKHYEKQARRIRSCCDHYLAVFMPNYVGRSPETVLEFKGVPLTRGTVAYEQNKGLDANGDGVITVADICAVHNNVVAAGRARGYIEVDTMPTTPTRKVFSVGTAIAGLALGTAAVLGYNYWRGVT